MSAMTALELRELTKTLKSFLEKEYLDKVYPIGSIYMSANDAEPSVLFGGTWERLKDRFLLGAGDDYVAGTTGGEKTVVLTKEQLATHMHPVFAVGLTEKVFVNTPIQTGGSGAMVNLNGELNANTAIVPSTDHLHLIAQDTASQYSQTRNQPHNNMPPYLAVYMWKRIA